MRKLRQLSMVVLLALTVSAPAFAGIIGCPPEAPPPPDPQSSSMVASVVLALIQVAVP